MLEMGIDSTVYYGMVESSISELTVYGRSLMSAVLTHRRGYRGYSRTLPLDTSGQCRAGISAGISFVVGGVSEDVVGEG